MSTSALETAWREAGWRFLAACFHRAPGFELQHLADEMFAARRRWLRDASRARAMHSVREDREILIRKAVGA